MRWLALATCAVLVAGCGKRTPSEVCSCDLAAQQPEVVAHVVDPSLEEISGLVASRRYDVVWVIEDSNNPAQVYALDFSGAVRTTVSLTGATNTDWEDLAMGPCPSDAAQSCLWAADIGDNAEARGDISAFVFPEPDASTASDVDVSAQQIVWTYPGGPANAEAFVVTEAGDAFVFTKRSDGVTVMLQAPIGGGELVEITTLFTGLGAGFSQATGADVRSDGDGLRLLLRTYGSVWEWVVPSADLTHVTGVTSRALPAPAETQGEAIGYAQECGFWSIGEAVQAPIYRLQCP